MCNMETTAQTERYEIVLPTTITESLILILVCMELLEKKIKIMEYIYIYISDSTN